MPVLRKTWILRHAKATLDVVSSLAVIVAAVVLTWTLVRNRTDSSEVASGAPGRAPVEDVSGLWIDAAKITNVQGEGRAVIVEFSDFQCPFCGRHARDTFPAIERDIIKAGRARYIAFHFPLDGIHPLALKAGEAAECAARQGRFWEMHERLFADTNALAPTELVRHADAIGLDKERFEACLAGEALEKVRADQAEGRRLGVMGTPSFFLGTMRGDGGVDLVRRIGGIATIETFEEEIAKLAPKQALGR